MIRRLIYCKFILYTTLIAAANYTELDQFIEKAMEQRNVPGVAVSIVEGDKVVYSKGFGKTGIDNNEKVDENTIFQLASVTKTFTSAAIGVKIINWDDEVIRHLPQFALKEPYPTRFATIRDLLAHRTGLPAFGGDLLGKLGYSNEEILFRVRFIDPATSFRNRAYYSNVGFFIAGELLGDWQKAVKESLLVPLNMTRSGFASNLDNSNVAFAHAVINGKVTKIPWDRTGGFKAAGAVTSTAADMGKWMIMHLNGTLLKPETIKEIFKPSMVGDVTFSEAPPIDTNYSFGLGWDMYTYKGQQIVEKGGALDGIRTVVTLIPEKKLGITVLSNLNLTMLPEAIRAKFLEIHLGKSEQDIQKEIAEREKKLATLLENDAKVDKVIPMPYDLNSYAGTYENELYGKFKVLVRNNSLVVEAGPAPFVGKLTHWSNNTFLLQWPVINSGIQQVTFTFGPDNKPLSFQTETIGNFLVNNN